MVEWRLSGRETLSAIVSAQTKKLLSAMNAAFTTWPASVGSTPPKPLLRQLTNPNASLALVQNAVQTIPDRGFKEMKRGP